LLFQSRSIHAILNFVHVISNLSGSIRTGLGREPSPSAEQSRAILAKRHHRHYRALDSASVFVTFNALSATMSSGASRHIRQSRLANGYTLGNPLCAHSNGRFRPRADHIVCSDVCSDSIASLAQTETVSGIARLLRPFPTPDAGIGVE
jgi:hypothetical protein